MIDEPQIVTCTQNALEFLGPLSRGASCWLHIESRSKVEVRGIALTLLRLGCCHIAVSGNHAEAVHDEIDDVVLEDERNLILTTWHTGDVTDIAQEVLAIDCDRTANPIRVIISLADSVARELAVLSTMIAALGAAV